MATAQLLGLQAAWESLGISRSMLYKLMDSGQIDSVKVGDRRMVPQRSIDAYVNRLHAEARGEQPAPEGDDIAVLLKQLIDAIERNGIPQPAG